MLNGKYINSKEIIANVFRDSQYTQELQYSSAIEWVFEALDLICCSSQFINDIAEIHIRDHRGKLPCNFERMTQASGLMPSGQQFPMRESTHTFHPVFKCNPNDISNRIIEENNTDISVDQFSKVNVLIDSEKPITVDSNGNPIFNFNNDFVVTINKNMLVGGTGNATCPIDATYKLNNDYIFTNFKEGKVLIAYKAIPVDKEGFPLIPDNGKYKQAVQCYLRMKIDYILWRKNDLEYKVFEYSEREWMWYCGAAQSAGQAPSIDKLESWKNMLQHLIPRTNLHQNFFSNLGDAERLTLGKP